MKVGSLFSGVGGFDLGMERVGMECAWQVEIDKKCRLVLDERFPHTTKFEDVRLVGKHNLEYVDVIVGGFPCQDLSLAGNRKGLEGERSGLWYEFYRVVREIKPRWVIIENVPGLLSSKEGRDLGIILYSLAELGYECGYRVLDSQYFGSAQKRRRVFIVASIREGRIGRVLFEAERVPENTGHSQETWKNFTKKIRTSSENRGGTKEIDDTNMDVVGYNILGAHGNAKYRHAYPTETARTLDGWTGKMNKNAASTVILDNGRVRRLTPLEAERLMGFPDYWTLVDGVTEQDRYKQMGNAVVVPVIEWLGRNIVFEEMLDRYEVMW